MLFYGSSREVASSGLTQPLLSTAVPLAQRKIFEAADALCQTASKAEKVYSSLLYIQTRGCKSSFVSLLSRHNVLGGLEVAFDTTLDELPFYHSC